MSARDDMTGWTREKAQADHADSELRGELFDALHAAGVGREVGQAILDRWDATLPGALRSAADTNRATPHGAVNLRAAEKRKQKLSDYAAGVAPTETVGAPALRACPHDNADRIGMVGDGNPVYRCVDCGATFAVRRPFDG